MTSQLEPTPGSVIVGHIYDKGGNMLGGARVICSGNSTITLCDGSFRFENLAPGTYTVTASLKGFQSQSKTVSINEDEMVTLDFSLDEAVGTANIRGYVCEAGTRKPLASAAVILILPLANKYASTDKYGRYEFTNLVADTYEVWVTIGGYEEEKATIAVKEGETKVQDFYCRAKRIEEPPWG